MRMVLAIWSSCIYWRKTPLSPFKGRGLFVEPSMLSVCISELLRYFSFSFPANFCNSCDPFFNRNLSLARLASPRLPCC